MTQKTGIHKSPVFWIGDIKLFVVKGGDDQMAINNLVLVLREQRYFPTLLFCSVSMLMQWKTWLLLC